jgi:hypothetical protein
MSDIYNVFFDFINKMKFTAEKERRRRRLEKEFDPLSWNLSNGQNSNNKRPRREN